MAVKKSGLGKGLDSLIKDNSSAKKDSLQQIHHPKIKQRK